MNLQKMFQIQLDFESEITKNTTIKEDFLGEENILDVMFLALNVKVGELANLTKCYKYFHAKPNIPQHKLIIRYSDVLRYLLSIGNRHQFNMIQTDDLKIQFESQNLIKLFTDLFDNLTVLKKLIRNDNYVESLNEYIQVLSLFFYIGKHLGLNEKDINDYFDSLENKWFTKQLKQKLSRSQQNIYSVQCTVCLIKKS